MEINFMNLLYIQRFPVIITSVNIIEDEEDNMKYCLELEQQLSSYR